VVAVSDLVTVFCIVAALGIAVMMLYEDGEN